MRVERTLQLVELWERSEYQEAQKALKTRLAGAQPEILRPARQEPVADRARRLLREDRAGGDERRWRRHAAARIPGAFRPRRLFPQPGVVLRRRPSLRPRDRRRLFPATMPIPSGAISAAMSRSSARPAAATYAAAIEKYVPASPVATSGKIARDRTPRRAGRTSRDAACRDPAVAAAFGFRAQPAHAETPDFHLDLDTGGHRAFVKDIAFTGRRPVSRLGLRRQDDPHLGLAERA